MKITNEIQMQIQQVQCKKKKLLIFCALKKREKKSKTPVPEYLGPSSSFTALLIHSRHVFYFQLDVILPGMCNFLLRLSCSARLAQRRLTVVMRKEQEFIARSCAATFFSLLFVKSCFFFFCSSSSFSFKGCELPH